MRIFVGADHNGYHLKEQVENYLRSLGHDVVDDGGKELNPKDDFTVYASRVAVDVLGTDGARGILICGSGQGMVIAANRYKGIRAGLGWSSEAAASIRTDEDSNVLALPSEILDGHAQQWQEIIDTWLRTEFAGAPRYVRRNKQLDEIG